MLEVRGSMQGNDPTAKSLPTLTRKQRDVLALVADNRTSKEIAARLDISESAVNQRIEMIRQRLGGLPRGELARLYRQEYAPNDEQSEHVSETWQKIHLPQGTPNSQGRAGAESISLQQSFGSHPDDGQEGDGSQLSALFFETHDSWLGRESRATALIRHGAILAIVTLALAFAAGITHLLGPAG
jgi:DNA-binding CsgD family transcriptional regulator